MSAFVIKIIAAVTMLIDHAGLVLFPQHEFMRIIGRLAFPIYAYCIAEGFRYTKNRWKYFLRLFLLGALCQIVYTVVDRELYLGVLISFSISIIIMFFVDCAKAASEGVRSKFGEWISRLLKKNISTPTDRLLSSAAALLCITAAFVLCVYVDVDYGFFGIMLPVMTNFFHDRTRRLVMFSSCLIALCIDLTGSNFTIQFWSLLTVPILAIYNGKPGKYRLKYFFYIFYPAHIALLYGISMLIR